MRPQIQSRGPGELGAGHDGGNRLSLIAILSKMSNQKLLRWTAVLFIILLVNTAYISAFASPTIFYMTNVLAHFGLGLLLSVALLFLVRRFPVAGALFLAAAALGVYLAIGGNITE